MCRHIIEFECEDKFEEYGDFQLESSAAVQSKGLADADRAAIVSIGFSPG